MALTEIDRNLLARCLERSPGSWNDFVDRFLGLFVHVVRHTAHSRSIHLTDDDVEDVCSEIFVTLLKDDQAILRNFRRQSSLATYLAVIARRIAVHELIRRRKAQAMGHVDGHVADGHPGAVQAPFVERIENEDEVARMLQKLPERDAQIVRMYHLEGKSYQEISVDLGISPNSIGPTLTRAREELRQAQAS